MFSALGNRFPARGVSPIGFSAETCQSGRMGHPAKVLSAQVDRGFKSHRLRGSVCGRTLVCTEPRRNGGFVHQRPPTFALVCGALLGRLLGGIVFHHAESPERQTSDGG